MERNPMMDALDRFHDAELVAISTNRDAKNVTLKFSVGGSKFEEISLKEVSHFRATDFIVQNVVSRIMASALGAMSLEVIEQKVRWVTSLGDNESFANDETVRGIVARIATRELMLFAIDPSWGAELVVIAKSWEIR